MKAPGYEAIGTIPSLALGAMEDRALRESAFDEDLLGD